MAAVKPLIAIVGQTATGKTNLAIELAKQHNGEIICADSRTVYKGMDICTAKPSRQEQAQAKHHLLDVAEVSDTFNVAQFKTQADRIISNVQKSNRLPILVGGSGLFVDAVLYDFGFSKPDAKRSQQNHRHLDKSVLVEKHDLRPNTLVIGLKISDGELTKRIEERADTMLANGLLEEIKIFSKMHGWDLPAFQEPAFKAFRPYFEGKCSLDEAKKVFVIKHRQYAKRQKTWFKRNPDILWVSTKSETNKIVAEFLNNILLQ